VLTLDVVLMLSPRFWIRGEDIPDTKACVLESILNSACGHTAPTRKAVWSAAEAVSSLILGDGFSGGVGGYATVRRFFRRLLQKTQRADPMAVMAVDTAAELAAEEHAPLIVHYPDFG
jgi:hypothetical protein